MQTIYIITISTEPPQKFKEEYLCAFKDKETADRVANILCDVLKEPYVVATLKQKI